jgi:tetratricopeptide (TPR) repeat protein
MPEKTSDNISRQARDLYNKAIGALERNNIDYAIEMFIQCLSLEPNFTQGRKFLRAAQMKKLEAGSSGLRRMFGSAKSATLLPKAKMAVSKNPTEAMLLAEQLLTEDPKSAQALQLLAEAADNAGYPETTAQTLEYLTKLNARDTKTLHWLAKTYFKIEKYDLGRDAYERIIQINPGDFEAQKGLNEATARNAMKGGGWEEATSFRDALKNEKEAVALEQASRVIRAEDMTENLIRETLQKLSQEPDNPVFKRELGRLYAQKGDFDAALQYLEALFNAEAGSDPSLEKEIGDIKVKRITTALTEKKKQLLNNPDDTVLQAKIAELEQQQDQVLLSETIRLVERYPNDLMYRYDLGVLYMKTGNIQDAVEQFQKSVGQPQRRVASLNFLGQCFQQMELHDLAIDQYLRAIEEVPGMDGVKKELIYNLGSAYEALGETDKAIVEYKKIAAVDFSYKDVRAKITRRPSPKTGS